MCVHIDMRTFTSNMISSSCSAKLVEFQTFDFVIYKLVTIVITTYGIFYLFFFFLLFFLPITITGKPACTEMLSECKKQVLHLLLHVFLQKF